MRVSRLLRLFALAFPALAGCSTFGGPSNPPLPPDNPAVVIEPTSAEAKPSTPKRRRPGRDEPEARPTIINPGALDPPIAAGPDATLPVPDRWRIVDTLGVKDRWWDPYNQNTLKGDRPILGKDDLFLVLGAVSDTVVEPRSFPTPVGIQTTEDPNSLDVFGDSGSFVFAQTFIPSIAIIKGSTAFKPQDYELRITPAIQYNYVDVEERRILNVDPSKASERHDFFIGLQEAFFDYHLRNVSERYDFDSIRIGIQPFNADFRGFLFQDNQLGVRLFGNRDGNRFQYNLAAFARVEKDTNSGLNDVTAPLRDDYILLANLFRQDLPLPGLTTSLLAAVNINREADDITIDDNGFPVRPALIGDLRGREYDVGYVGSSLDGRVGRINLAASVYHAFGENRGSDFTGETTRINAWFAAVEPSIDYDWARFRLAALYASGDEDPFDDEETGFDSINENPLFAGADTSYWIRQTIPFAGGGRVIGLNGRNGILNTLRSSKEQGQSNFTNPGTVLIGGGADFDVLPSLRISLNANHLWFDDTASLSALRIEGPIDRTIGYDLSAAAIYRPDFIQNVVFRLSGASLLPQQGFTTLFGTREEADFLYSVLFNAVLTY